MPEKLFFKINISKHQLHACYLAMHNYSETHLEGSAYRDHADYN